MRIVAIRAVHKAFVDPVLVRQLEITAHIRMTAVTELSFRLGEKIFGRGRLVNGMTVVAGYAVHRVRGSANVAARQAFGMATQAHIHAVGGRQLGKGLDGSLTAVGLDV